MVTDNRFWRMVDACRREAEGDLHTFLTVWEEKLGALQKDEVKEISEGLFDALAGLSDWKVFGAAWLFSGGSRDDFMLRFSEWVICNGEEFYREALANPDKIPSLPQIEGRWHEAKITASTRHISTTRFGESWVGKSDRALWQPVVSQLNVSVPEGASNTLTCLTLKNVCPYSPDKWRERFPHLNAVCEQNKISPSQDRRTPMTYEKFWLLIDDAKSCHDASSFLTYSLQCLPTAQIIDFDSILDDLLSRAEEPMRVIRQSDVSVAELTNEELGSILVVLGKEVYSALLQDPELWSDLNSGYERWKGQRLRQAAKQAFFEKTGHADPLVA